nr:MAG TPA: Protein of unknown function (DUF2719) [Caudoviricetes sp.]
MKGAIIHDFSKFTCVVYCVKCSFISSRNC